MQTIARKQNLIPIYLLKICGYRKRGEKKT